SWPKGADICIVRHNNQSILVGFMTQFINFFYLTVYIIKSRCNFIFLVKIFTNRFRIFFKGIYIIFSVITFVVGKFKLLYLVVYICLAYNNIECINCFLISNLIDRIY